MYTNCLSRVIVMETAKAPITYGDAAWKSLELFSLLMPLGKGKSPGVGVGAAAKQTSKSIVKGTRAVKPIPARTINTPPSLTPTAAKGAPAPKPQIDRGGTTVPPKRIKTDAPSPVEKPLTMPTQKPNLDSGNSSSSSGSSSSSSSSAPSVHGNSKQYVGKTHVYVIKNTSTGQAHKIGESMQGLNKQGQSKRAITQARKLERTTGDRYKTEIRKTFDTKAEARNHETRTIEKFRELFGDDQLPGNKGNR